MPFIVVYDSNVLYPNTLRDLLIRLAQSGIVQAKWTDRILDEVFANIVKNRPDIAPEKLVVLRRKMNDAIGDVLVTGHEPLINDLSLPDPDDRHVVAAAIKCKAQVIVTENMKHFPKGVLAEWGIEPKRADDFVLDQISLDAKVVYACVQQIVDSRKLRPETVEDVLAQLERSGLTESAAALRVA